MNVSPAHSVAAESSSSLISAAPPRKNSRWKPMCLYFTQGKCTKMDDEIHTERFSHNFSIAGKVASNASQSVNLRQQGLEFLLVLDLEGKVEILEFPVLLFDTKTMDVIDFFHRFVRPSKMSEQRISEYIEGKYGKFGVDRVWHDTAIPFREVIEQFEAWLGKNELWQKDKGGCLSKAAFVTWELNIPPFGSHHLGIDDSKNIARVLQHMLNDGAYLQVTAKRSHACEEVKFLFKNRIR
ncbi:unnamed protein product [Cuscuta campestris]|uniref:Exonuclease domain-containing protein n=1 Tax=Cuscuta campestris TaxID=132261 RepID=A0A484NBY6_9ASTE|nr:unnamed protein product [Cuscuta campestris]